jgi:hypothetical protein
LFGKPYTTKNRWRSWIVTSNSLVMLGFAALAIALFCALIAYLQNVRLTPVTAHGIEQFAELTRCNGFRFFYLSTDRCDVLYNQVSRDWALFFLYIARTVAVALLLSVILVKLLTHRDLFVMRPRICLAPTEEKDLPGDVVNRYWEKQGGWELRCRFYNATPLTLLNLKFSAKLRRPVIMAHDWLLKNKTITLSTPSWAVALPFVPLSVRIALDRAADLDINYADSNGTDRPLRLKSIQGHACHPLIEDAQSEAANAKSFLVINIEGAIDEADKNLIESLWWPITHEAPWFDEGRERPIKVHPGAERLKTGGKPERWEGWDAFDDGVLDIYVFGYGSLMAEWLDEEESHIANLEGFERDWRATMDNSIRIADYKVYEARSEEQKPPYVSFVNVSQSTASACVTGIVKPVSLWQLAQLDHRERNYLRIDVTDSIRFIGPQADHPKRPYTVWTYTASQASHKRFNQLKDLPVVSQEYYDKYLNASQRLATVAPAGSKIHFQLNKAFSTRELEVKEIPG